MVRFRATADKAPTLLTILQVLDRLEDLLEEMDELGFASRADLVQRIAELHVQVSHLTGEDDG